MLLEKITQIIFVRFPGLWSTTKITKIINLFAGPGSGKSTTAAGLFFLMKTRGYSVELIHEFAKDLTWRGRHNTLQCQPYVFGKQLERTECLLGQVEYIITDSPILLSAIYNDEEKYPEFQFPVIDIFDKYDNLNYFIQRVKPYNPVGRNQTEEQSKEIDTKIKDLLECYIIPYKCIPGNIVAPSKILKDINAHLK